MQKERKAISQLSFFSLLSTCDEVGALKTTENESVTFLSQFVNCNRLFQTQKISFVYEEKSLKILMQN